METNRSGYRYLAWCLMVTRLMAWVTCTQDREFKKEMESLTSSEEWKKGLEDAHKLLSDPEAVAAMQKQVCCLVKILLMFG